MEMSAAAGRVRVIRVHRSLYLPPNSRTPRQGIRSVGLMRTQEEIKDSGSFSCRNKVRSFLKSTHREGHEYIGTWVGARSKSATEEPQAGALIL